MRATIALIAFVAFVAVCDAVNFSDGMKQQIQLLRDQAVQNNRFPAGKYVTGPGERCNCNEDVCNCCAERTPPPGPVCLDLTLDPNAQTILVELTVNGQVVWSGTHSGDKPLTKCVTKVCEFCFHLHNVNISRQTGACGEVTLNVTCPIVPVHPEKTKQFFLGQNSAECTIPAGSAAADDEMNWEYHTLGEKRDASGGASTQNTNNIPPPASAGSSDDSSASAPSSSRRRANDAGPQNTNNIPPPASAGNSDDSSSNASRRSLGNNPRGRSTKAGVRVDSARRRGGVSQQTTSRRPSA